MNCSFFKKVFFAAVLCVFGSALVFAQESYDDFEDWDDLDDLFGASEDIVVEQSAPVVVAAPASADSSVIKFFGSMSADVGAAATFDKKFQPSGYFDFTNTLKMKVRPSSTISVNGAITTSVSNKFSLGLDYLYFDYLAFDKIYISAGKKNESLGGYTRLFTESAVTDTSGLVNVEVKYPWSTGTLILLGAYNQNKVTANPFAADITYAVDLEQTIGHTSVNVFAKKYAAGELIDGVHKHPAVGIEAKRTLFGFDAYVQGIASLADYTKLASKNGYERIAATAGFYRLWDGLGPDFGLNIEYKYVWTPLDQNVTSNQFVYVQAGIKNLGKNKNLKFGLDWNHNITESSGDVKAAFLVGGLFPYANWSNAVELKYTKEGIVPSIASFVSISLDY